MQTIELLQDTSAILPDRQRALQAFVEPEVHQQTDGCGFVFVAVPIDQVSAFARPALSVGERQSTLIRQLRIELQREDNQFVLPLLDGLGHLFHRDAVGFLVEIAQNVVVELTFRLEAVSLLTQFYLHAVTDLDLPFSTPADGYLDPVLSARHASNALDNELFVQRGTPPNTADLNVIKEALKAVAVDPDAPVSLQDEAQSGIRDTSAIDALLQR